MTIPEDVAACDGVSSSSELCPRRGQCMRHVHRPAPGTSQEGRQTFMLPPLVGELCESYIAVPDELVTDPIDELDETPVEIPAELSQRRRRPRTP